MGRTEKIPVGNEKIIEHEGYFDYDVLLEHLLGPIESEKYYDVTDNYRKRKIADDGTITYDTHAGLDLEYTDYLKGIIDLEIFGEGIPEVVNIEGIPKKLIKGKVKLVIKSYIEPDWLEKMGRFPFIVFMNLIKERLFTKTKIEKLTKQIMKDRQFLQEQFDKAVF